MDPPQFTFSCGKPFCNALDFIPARCDHCLVIFCGEHLCYDKHSCAKPEGGDPQVIICPLCDMKVPSTCPAYNLNLTAKVHVDQHCQSDLAVARREWVIKLMRSCAW